MQLPRLLSTVLLTLGALAPACSAPGDWSRLGEEGAWKNAVAGVVFGNRLITAEKDGHLYETDLANGNRSRFLESLTGRGGIAETDCSTIRYMVASDRMIYAITSDGVLRTINEADKSIGGFGDEWKGTIAMAFRDGKIYTLEESGALYRTNPEDGKWEQVGTKSPYAGIRIMFPLGANLYTIGATTGNLSRVNPASGAYATVGATGTWKNATLAAPVGERFYTVSRQSGNLYENNASTGAWKTIGKTDYKNTRLLFGSGEKLYTLEEDGSLYEVSVR